MNIYMILSFAPFSVFLMVIFVYQFNFIRVDRNNPAIERVMDFNERKVTKVLLANYINYSIGFLLLYLHVYSLEEFGILRIVAYVLGMLTLISGAVNGAISGIKAFCFVIGYFLYRNDKKLCATIQGELDKVHDAFNIPEPDLKTEIHEIKESMKLIIAHETVNTIIYLLFSILSVTVLLKLVFQ